MLTASKRCLVLLEKCRNVKQLKQAHGSMITCGIGDNSFALSRLLALCSLPFHGCLSYTRKIFEQIEDPTICICNTMMKAFLVNDEMESTIHLYRFMLRNNIGSDHYTLPYLLKACSKMEESCRIGELLHGHGLKLGFLSDIFVGNGLISMYSTYENMEAARLVFDETPWQCVVSWTVLISGYVKKEDVYTARLVFDEASVKDRGIWGAMISGYVQNNCFKEGLHLFRLMQQSSGIKPDEGILVSLLCASAHLGCLDIGIWIHKYMGKMDMQLSVRLGTALIDMYARCGCLDLAKKVFTEMPQRDIICWNVMISGFAMNGDGETALRLFEEMGKSGVRPDDITFISMFTALSFAGMAHEGLRLLWTMNNVYKIQPKSEHYGCIVDLFSRTGLLEEAKNIIIHSMPISNDAPFEEAIAWRALLSASCSHGEVTLAEDAAERLVNLEHGHSGAYVLLSNAYSAVGRHDSAKKMRKKMKNRGIDKAPGCSLVQINGVVNEFIAGENTHPNMEEIHGILEIVNKQFDSLTNSLAVDLQCNVACF